jgi:hypothetical protein
MITIATWKDTFEAEIQQAETARAAGNEGMARVCARRAAGAAAGEYLQRRGIDLRTPSAYDRLRFLSELSGVSPRAAQAAARLLTRVTPEYTLPVEADLIAEARQLRQELLGE